MSTVRPHRWQPVRPLSPGFSRQEHWSGFPLLFQCMKVKSESEVAQSCPTLSDPIDCSLPGSSVHGIFQVRVLEWGAIAFSKSHISVLTMQVLLCTVFFAFLNLKDVINFMLIYGRFWELKIKFVCLCVCSLSYFIAIVL